MFDAVFMYDLIDLYSDLELGKDALKIKRIILLVDITTGKARDVIRLKRSDDNLVSNF